jgi:thiamine-phosphate pyrophosphorylase
MICLVTDRARLSADADAVDRLVELAASAARARIDLFQIREPDLDARVLTNLVARCCAAVARTSTRIVVNDRADVAIAARADGVHLRGDSYSARAARSLIGEHAVVGRSVHSVEEAAAVSRAGGIDYLIFGTMHQTASKASGHPVATLDDLRAACQAAANAPVLAIGGMTIERAAHAARAGAAGIAGIGLFVPPQGQTLERHLQTVAAQLRRVFDTCQAVS